VRDFQATATNLLARKDALVASIATLKSAVNDAKTSTRDREHFTERLATDQKDLDRVNAQIVENQAQQRQLQDELTAAEARVLRQVSDIDSSQVRSASDRIAEAKALCDQASDALDAGDFTRGFQLAASSIKLHKTAKGYMVRARAEQRLGRADDALMSLDAAAELAPNYGAVWEQRGRIQWAARRVDEARASFSRFLELSPKSTSAPEIERLLNEPR
jgi:tetratricopeptide (TPR) repeat protein